MKKMIHLLTAGMLAAMLIIFAGCSAPVGGSSSSSSGGGTPAVSSPKAITAFGIASPAATGMIDETAHTIAVTVPYGTTVTTLVATFTTTGASVKINGTVQTSGTTANNFGSAQTYIVTASDGTTQPYTVTVTVASNSAKAITAFSFLGVTNVKDGYSGNVYGTTISGTAITVKLPYGSTSMVAVFTTTGALVSIGGVVQTSGVTSNDFKNPVTYRVAAADGSTQDYTVTALFAPAVHSGPNSTQGGVLSSYWYADTSTSTDCNYMELRLTCDAINAGSDNLTMTIITPYGIFMPHPPTVPSDTTATYLNGDERRLEIVGPLNSIQSVIAKLQYVPPTVVSGGECIDILLKDKNGLIGRGRIEMTVSAPGGG